MIKPSLFLLVMPIMIAQSGWNLFPTDHHGRDDNDDCSEWLGSVLPLIIMDVMLLMFAICRVVSSWCAVPLALLVTGKML